jgi:hypothetical protein
MWRQVYDINGLKVPDNRMFFAALSASSEQATPQSSVKVELLNTELRAVRDSTIFSADRTNSLTNFITDGNIDVDSTRGARRTAELTLMNPTAEFTPGTDSYQDGAGVYTGKIYLNRIVRIWRGAYVGGQPYFVPARTFMVDGASVIMERNMSLVTLTLTDLWKKLNKSYVGADEKVYDKNTNYNDIIRDLIDDSGVDLDAAHIGSLSHRDLEDRRTQSKITLREGESRGDRLKALSRQWNIDVYFDPMGSFRSEDRATDTDRSIAWTFSTPPITTGAGGHLVTLTRSFNDDNLYNHVVVVYHLDDKNKTTKRVFKANTNQNSSLSIDRIGRRVLIRTYESIHTEAAANRALDRLWRLRTQLSETIEAQVISNPALEADDVVRFREDDFVKVDDAYRLSRFTVPLVSNLQTVQAMNVLREENF